MRGFLKSRWPMAVGMVLAVVMVLLGHAAAAATPAPFMLGNTVDVTNISEAMKIFFTDPIVNNVVTDTELLKVFTVDSNVQYEQSTGGRYIETAQYFQLPAGVGARAPGEYLPVPNGPVIKNSKVYLKKLQGVIEMSGDVMSRVRGDMGAYLNWMDRAMPDLVTRFNDSVDRMLLGYGAGIKARIAAGGVAGNVITIDRAFGATVGGNSLTQAWLNFLEGENIVFSANPTGQPLRNAGAGQSCNVTSIDQTLSKLTVDALPAAAVANDYIFEGDPAGTSSQTAAGDDREIQGLLGMVDDGTVLATFQGLLRSSYRLWNSIQVDSTDTNLDAAFNGSLSEDVMTFADDQVAILGGGRPDLIVTSRFGLRTYWKQLRADRQINDPRGFVGGKGPLELILGDRTVPIKAVRKMPPQLAFLLQTDTFKRWELDSLKWDDKTGSVWNRVTDATGRKDAFYAVANWYMQTGNIAPRKNVRVVNIGF